MSRSANRRRSIRLTIAACAAIESLGMRNECNQGLGTVRDVSRTGIGLETGQPPRCGQLVKLRIALGDEIHELAARTTRVTWIQDSNFYRVGLDWELVNEEQEGFLERVFLVAETFHC